MDTYTFQNIARRLQRLTFDHGDEHQGANATVGRQYVDVVLEELGLDIADVAEMLDIKHNGGSRREDDRLLLNAIVDEVDLLNSMKACPSCGCDVISVSFHTAEHKNCACTRCGEASRMGPVSTEQAISIWNDHCEAWYRVAKNYYRVRDTEVDV